MSPLADIAHEVADRLDQIADALGGLLRLQDPSPIPGTVLADDAALPELRSPAPARPLEVVG